jgi:hypothetical protein
VREAATFLPYFARMPLVMMVDEPGDPIAIQALGAQTQAESKEALRARGRIDFGQIRTHRLRIFARIRQIDEMPISPLRCGVTQNYVEIAQTREVFKSGSNPVRGRFFSSAADLRILLTLLCLINLVDFYQADADGVVIAPDDRGEGA